MIWALINPTGRKNKAKRQIRHTYWFSSAKCWLLIIHLKLHRYFCPLGSLFQQLINRDWKGCWIFHRLLDIHFLVLRWGGNGKDFIWCSKTFSIHPTNLYWALCVIKWCFRLWVKFDGHSEEGDIIQAKRIVFRTGFWNICEAWKYRSVARQASRIEKQCKQRHEDGKWGRVVGIVSNLTVW